MTDGESATVRLFSLVGAQDPPILRGSQDSVGAFSFPCLPYGWYCVTAQAGAKAGSDCDIRIGANDEVHRNVLLSSMDVVLSGIVRDSGAGVVSEALVVATMPRLLALR